MKEPRNFGKYEILHRLGKGMADVYLAREPARQEPVVLKIIRSSHDDPASIAVEAERRGAQLQRELHKADKRILDVFDHGQEGDCFFVAMEYFPGRTLAAILQAEHRLEPKRAARFAAECCSQLRTLHGFISPRDGFKTAVIHGDVKPSNIQIGTGDQLRLIDFGIAKLISKGRDLTHHCLGSPSYCSPERLRESQIDVHSDLWALGVSLYEMLAGSPPFVAEDTQQLERLIQQRKAPRQLPPDCPPDLRAIVDKALAGDFRKRYASAEAFESDLRAFAKGQTVQLAQEKHQTSKPTVVRVVRRAKNQKAEDGPTKGEVSAGPGLKGSSRAPLATKSQRLNIAVAGLAGALAGLVLLIPALSVFRLHEIKRALGVPKNYLTLPSNVLASDWQSYQSMQHYGSWWSKRLISTTRLRKEFEGNLFRSADNALKSFRASSDGELNHFDWVRGRLCLLYALEIEPADRRARAELHLFDGYINLGRGLDSSSVRSAIAEFRRAQELLPRSPDPHLALARTYIYGLHNVGAAIAEYHQAAQLGFRLGPRETEQKADGYLFRAESELASAGHRSSFDVRQAVRSLQLAQGDLNRAEALYQPIAGYSDVNTRLTQVDQDRGQQLSLLTKFSDAQQAGARVRCSGKGAKRGGPCLSSGELRPVLVKAHFTRRSVSYQWP